MSRHTLCYCLTFITSLEDICRALSINFLKCRWFSCSLLWLFYLFAAHTTSAQTQPQKLRCINDCSCDMAGKVVDQLTKLPLPYATIQLKGTTEGTIADDEGVFHLHNLCSDEFDLVISFVGYKSITHHHDLYHHDPVIYLSPDELQLESVVVEGVKQENGMISATVTSISPEEISSRRGERLGDVLQRLPGVSTLSTGQNVVKPVVHGLHSSRLLIINNGVRHESQSWGADHAPEIDPSQANNIRLIKGAASVKYGPGALGGVILINPPQPKLTTTLKGEADVTLQSNGRSAGGTVSVQEGYSRLAWIAQAAGLYQGDLHAPDYTLSNTGARESSFSAGALYHKRQLDLNIHYSYFQQKLGILRGSVVGNLRDLAFAMANEPPAYTNKFSYTINTPHQEVRHHLLKLNGNLSFGSSNLNFQYAFQANERQEFDVRRGTNNFVPSINLTLLTHATEAEWEHPVWGLFSGSVGIQAQYQDNNNIAGTNTIPFLPNYNNLNIGAFLSESAQLGNTIFDAGVRYDIHYASVRGRDIDNSIFRNELNYHSITASTGFLRPLSAWSSLQSNLGLAWRPPNMAELYSLGKHEAVIENGLWRYMAGRGTGVYSQEEKPAPSELSYKWVNTYSYHRNRASLELTGYINYIQNYIFSKPAGITTTSRGALPFFIYDQTNALLAGLDGSLTVEHTKHWESDLRLMFLQATNTKNSERFVGIPPSRITYSLNYTVANLGTFSSFITGMEASYTLKQYLAPPVISPEEILAAGGEKSEILTNAASGFDFLPAPDAYFLLNAYAGIEKGRFSYRLRVRNILNTSYRDFTNRLRYFADEAGRNFALTIKYRF